MDRRTPFDWLSSHPSRRWPSRRRLFLPRFRRVRVELLEDRRLLAITVNTLVDEADGSIADGDISLRDAIALAAPGETIDFSVTGTIDLTVGPNSANRHLRINKALTINGPGADLLTIRAFDSTPAVKDGGGSRVFVVDDGNIEMVDVVLSGLTLTGGDVGGFINNDGGAIFSREKLAVADSVISGNHASGVLTGLAADGGAGGGIFAVYMLTLINCTVSNNSASFEGGGVRASSILSVTGSTISENSTLSFAYGRGEGGGLSAIGDNITITGSTISANVAASEGGGIYVGSSSNLLIADSTISGNSAFDGGGIGSVGTTTLRYTTVSNNTATYGGGISHNPNGSLLIENSTISHNSAAQGGGVLSETSFVGLTSMSVVNSTFSGNAATVVGGGIFNGEGPLLILHSTIANNTAPP